LKVPFHRNQRAELAQRFSPIYLKFIPVMNKKDKLFFEFTKTAYLCIVNKITIKL